MGRRRRTLLNAPTGRTHTAPPARQRAGAPVAHDALAYGQPQLSEVTLEPDEDDIPTEIAPQPFDKEEDVANTADPKPVEQLKEAVDPPHVLQDKRRESPEERFVPALVMVGVVGLVVIAVLIAALFLR